jgi:cytochrome o ubiquinol oxidase subunit IV
MKGTLRSYITGFVVSILLTLVSFVSVSGHLFSSSELFSLILILAMIQFTVQLIFFLHLGRDKKPLFNLVVFSATLGMVLIIVGGSVWIMNHLNNNMMLSPRQMENYMQNQSDGGGY